MQSPMQPPTQPSLPSPQMPSGPVQDPQEQSARNWAMACHLAGLSAFIGVPFGHIVGPWIVWVMKKDEIPLVNDQGREAINFGLSLTIYYFIMTIGAALLIGIPFLIMTMNEGIAGLLALGFTSLLGLAILPIIHIILAVVAALRASAGEVHRYPFTIRFIN